MTALFPVIAMAVGALVTVLGALVKQRAWSSKAAVAPKQQLLIAVTAQGSTSDGDGGQVTIYTPTDDSGYDAVHYDVSDGDVLAQVATRVEKATQEAAEKAVNASAAGRVDHSVDLPSAIAQG